MIAGRRTPPYDTDFRDLNCSPGATGSASANRQTGRIKLALGLLIPDGSGFAFGSVGITPLGPFPDATPLNVEAVIACTAKWTLFASLARASVKTRLDLSVEDTAGTNHISTDSNELTALATPIGWDQQTSRRLVTLRTTITPTPDETLIVFVNARQHLHTNTRPTLGSHATATASLTAHVIDITTWFT